MKNLASLVDSRSKLIFNILQHDKQKMEWPQLPPNMWNLMSPYEEFKQFACIIPIVNDDTERNIHILKHLVSVSHDEDLRQDLFLVL